MINDILPPVSLEPAATKAAVDSIDYFNTICNRPIEYPDYNIAHDAAIRILAIQVADNGGEAIFWITEDIGIEMSYNLVRMGGTTMFEMTENLIFKGISMKIRQITYDDHDNLCIYTEDCFFAVHVIDLEKECKKMEFERRIEKNGIR